MENLLIKFAFRAFIVGGILLTIGSIQFIIVLTNPEKKYNKTFYMVFYFIYKYGFWLVVISAMLMFFIHK